MLAPTSINRPEDVENLLRSIISGKHKKPFTFIAGAGISIDSGLPDFLILGRNILQGILGSSSDAVSDDEIAKIVQYVRPELLLQTLHDIFGNDILTFCEYLVGETPNPAHEMLAKALHHGHNVVTTNLDSLVEKAYETLYGEKVRVIVSIQDFQRVGSEIRNYNKLMEPTVIKPHGTINLDESDVRERYKHVRMCLDQVGQSLSIGCKKVVEHLVKETPMIFLGYSGCDHFSLQPVLCNTATDKTALWLFHSEKESKMTNNACDLREAYDEIRVKVRSGSVYADIDRGMEMHAVCMILLSRKHSALWQGNVSELIHKVTGQNQNNKKLSVATKGVPAWVENISQTKKVLTACRLFKLANMYDKIGRCVEQLFTLCCFEDNAVAELDLFLGEIQMEKKTNAASESAERFLEEASMLFRKASNQHGVVECALTVVNLKRLRGDLTEALKKLSELEVYLRQASPYNGLEKHKIQIVLQKGLIFSHRGDNAKRDESVKMFKRAVNLAETRGFPILKSSCLNGLALALSQGSRHSKSELFRAAHYVNGALEISSYCGLTRSLFEQHRTLGLIHIKMASVEDEPIAKEKMHLKALADYQNAEAFLQRSAVGFLEDDVLETKYLIAKVLVKLSRDEEAIRVLNYVIERRQHENDWFNQARAIDLVLRTKKNEVFCRYMGQLLDIYRSVLSDMSKFEFLLAEDLRLKATKNILENAIGQASRLNVEGIEEELQKCLDSLTAAINERRQKLKKTPGRARSRLLRRILCMKNNFLSSLCLSGFSSSS